MNPMAQALSTVFSGATWPYPTDWVDLEAEATQTFDLRLKLLL